MGRQMIGRNQTKMQFGCSDSRRSTVVCRALVSSAVLLVSILSSTFAQGQNLEYRSSQDEGFTEPLKTVFVASPESGVIQSLSVREGDIVRQGDIIAKLDTHVLEATANAARQRLQAKGKINAAKATLQNKTHHLRQMQELFENEHASDQEVKQAQLEYDLASASLETTQDEFRAQEMEVKKIEAQLDRRIVRAPNSGVVLELPRQVGEAITASESHVATIVALNELRVRYFLTTSQALAMKRGQRLRVLFPETNQQAVAKIDFVAPVTDSNSGTVRVELLIDNKNNEYHSGLRCVLGETNIASQVSPTTIHQ